MSSLLQAVFFGFGKALYRLGLAGIIIRLTPDRLRAVLYHAVEDVANPYTDGLGITHGRACFESQVRYFSQHYRIVSTSQLDASLPACPLLITFDDGYMSVHDHALPILGKYHAPATVFLNGRAVENELVWVNELNWALHQEFETCHAILSGTDADAELVSAVGQEDIRRCVIHVQETFSPARIDALSRLLRSRIDFESDHRLYLSRRQIRKMQKTGFEFGFHSQDHYNLRLCCDAQLRQQLDASSLCHLLDVRSFAYPFGYYNDAVKSAVAAKGFDPVMAVGTGNKRQLDRHVDRIEIFHSDAASIFSQLEIVEPLMQLVRRLHK
jgi:peptidoglycan/xylan/chitin deacetylase (PgdA/CDA1 family)